MVGVMVVGVMVGETDNVIVKGGTVVGGRGGEVEGAMMMGVVAKMMSKLPGMRVHLGVGHVSGRAVDQRRR